MATHKKNNENKNKKDIVINGIRIKELLEKGGEFSDHEDQIDFLKNSYVGGDDYRNGEYLSRHKRESKISYKHRIEKSVFTNYVSPVVDIYNGYLHREKKERKNEGINKSLYEAYIKDADLNGRTHEKLMREVSRISSLMGSVGILIDSPSESSGNLGSDLINGLHTYAKVYTLENIINMIYTFDTGRPVLDIVVLEEDFEADEDYYVIYTRTEWFRIKKKGAGKAEIVSEGVHTLGIVPFILHKNKDSLLETLGVSDVTDIAELNKRVYQLDSAAMEIIDNTAFPFLEVPKRQNIGGQDGEIVIGTTNVLEVDPDSPNSKHRWIEPDGKSLDKILSWRNQCLEDIKYHSKIGGTDAANGTKTAESGVSLEIRFQQLNSILADKAESLENTENGMFTLIAMWNNSLWNGEINYSRRFGVRDLSFELDQLMKSKTIVASKTFNAEVSEKVVRKVLNDVDEDTIKKIMSEVESTPDNVNVAGNSVDSNSLNGNSKDSNSKNSNSKDSKK